MSPTKLGEYCVRCAKKSVIAEKDGYQVYLCPNGHWIQLITDKPDSPDLPPPETGGGETAQSARVSIWQN